ncbi:MAG TPA: class I adenylate-forming enzyme family protein [Candidatus Wallbacteria bacterium]|nr:class I adenylate-forming enzyme family protein [Candidatus Wallbacteria bacterium]
MDILNTLKEYSIKKPSGAFLFYETESVTYGTLYSEVLRVAESYSSAGFSKGDVCGLMAASPVRFIVYFLASLRTGVVCVLLNKKSGAEELQKIVNISGIKSIITDSAFSNPAGVFCRDGSEINYFCPEIIEESPDTVHPKLSPEDGAIFMLITSGTGGMQKIVKKTLGAMAFQSEKLMPQISTAGSELRYFANVPMSHSYGIEFALYGAIINGARLYLSAFRFSEAAMKEIADNSITHVFTVPPFIINLVNYKKNTKTDFPALEMVVSAGMRLAPVISEGFFGEFGFNISSVYGITELGNVSFKPSRKGERECDIDNNVGAPLEGNEILVLDDDGRPLPLGSPGRVIVKKAVPDGGYYEETPSAALKKWSADHKVFETDDIGYLDESGSLHLLGRSAAYINIGGEKINSFDIENFLRETRLFKEVLVWGKDDGFLGERIAAAAVLENGVEVGEDEVREICRKSLPLIKVPREINLFKDPFPKTATGKVRFDQVVKMCAARDN